MTATLVPTAVASTTLGALDPDALKVWVRATVDAAIAKDEDVGTWCLNVTVDAFDRWPCNDDDCPARPAWDADLARLFDRLVGIEDQIHRKVRKHFERELSAFAAQHPEALRKAAVQ